MYNRAYFNLDVRGGEGAVGTGVEALLPFIVLGALCLLSCLPSQTEIVYPRKLRSSSQDESMAFMEQNTRTTYFLLQPYLLLNQRMVAQQLKSERLRPSLSYCLLLLGLRLRVGLEW